MREKQNQKYGSFVDGDIHSPHIGEEWLNVHDTAFTEELGLFKICAALAIFAVVVLGVLLMRRP